MPRIPRLLAVPNLSEGRDYGVIAALEGALGGGVELLDRHTDADHNRTVLTIAGEAENLSGPLAALSEEAARLIDMRRHEGLHPCIGSLDVCPIVFLDPADRGAARAEAHALAQWIGMGGVPIFFYGDLASVPQRAERSYFRDGGLPELRRRMASGELRPDAGPAEPHPSAGATLITARPPLAAFNVEVDTADVETARAIAAGLRESGGGLPGVRAIGLELERGTAQVSINVHDPIAVPLAAVVERIRELASAHGFAPVEAELVGLVPEGAVAGYPDDVPIRGFEPDLHIIERRLNV